MRWRTGRRSGNIEDRRGRGMFGGLGGGPGGGMRGGLRRGGARGAGIGGIGLVIAVVIALLLGVDPSMLLQGLGPSGYDETAFQQPGAPDGGASDEMKEFVSVVLADTEDTWHELFAKGGGVYEEPTLVLFSGAVQSGCGYASAQVGPFYCPTDRKVYLDLEFFAEMARRFEAPGDFAQAYVIAHEIGHAVQDQTGILPEFNAQRGAMSQDEQNAYSVKVELQADCYAGVWANYEKKQNFLDSGDAEEAIRAANQIGDDTLTRGQVSPRNFTHGTSEQRMRWLKRGMDSGDVGQCDTFNGSV